MGKNDHDRPGISDEEWARFMAQAAQGAGDAPKEPSARARMVTERLRATQGQEPPGWRTGPAPRVRRRPGRLGAVLAVLGIAGLALIAVRPELVIDRITGKTAAREEAAKAARSRRRPSARAPRRRRCHRTCRPSGTPSGGPRPCSGRTAPQASRRPRPPP